MQYRCNRPAWKGGSYTDNRDAKSYANTSLYYAVYNPVSVVPTDAAYTCMSHLSSMQSGSQMGQIGGTATLSIANTVIEAAVSLDVKPASGSVVPLNQTARFQDGGLTSIVGNVYSSSSGVAVTIRNAVDGLVIVSPYKAVSSQATDLCGYRGVHLQEVVMRSRQARVRLRVVLFPLGGVAAAICQRGRFSEAERPLNATHQIHRDSPPGWSAYGDDSIVMQSDNRAGQFGVEGCETGAACPGPCVFTPVAGNLRHRARTKRH